MSEEGELRDTLGGANRVPDEVPETTPPKPIEARGGLAPHPVVHAGVRPDLQASPEVPRCLAGVVPVEKELPALLPVLDALEVIASIALIRTELPAEVLAKIAAEVNRPTEMPAQMFTMGTPASISARQPPHTEAIEEEPLDSVMSETRRIV